MRLGRDSCCRFSDVSAGSHNKGQMQVLTFNYQAIWPQVGQDLEKQHGHQIYGIIPYKIIENCISFVVFSAFNISLLVDSNQLAT